MKTIIVSAWIVKIKYKNILDLILKISDNSISFERKRHANRVVNVLCYELLGIEVHEYQLGSKSFDVDEHLNKSDILYEVDWYDLLSFDFDTLSMAMYLDETTNLGKRYTIEEINDFIYEYLTNWQQNVIHTLKMHLVHNP